MRQKVFFIVVALTCRAISGELQSQQEKSVSIPHQPVERKLLSFPDMSCSAPVWSPDGKHIAFFTLPTKKEDIAALDKGASPKVGVWVVGADGKEPKRVHQGLLPAWMPNSKEVVAISEDGGIVLVDVAHGYRTPIYRRKDADICFVGPSPDGRMIAFPQMDEPRDPNTLHVINVEGSGERKLADAGGTTTALSWSPDSRMIAYGIYDEKTFKSGLWIAPLSEKEKPFRVTDGEAADLWSPTRWWSPDSRRIAVYDLRAREMILVDVRTRERQVLLKGRPVCHDLSWSPDGKWIAFKPFTRDGVSLHVISADGKKTAQLTPTPTNRFSIISGYDWSPDSRRLIFVRDGDLFVTDVPKAD